MSEKYAFIAAQYVDHAGTAAKAPTIVQMTDWLGVSKSGYYESCARPVSDAEARRDELKVRIAVLFNDLAALRVSAHSRRAHPGWRTGRPGVGTQADAGVESCSAATETV